MTYSDEYHFILNHPYTQKLLATDEFDIDHPYDAPEHVKEYSLTAGTLAGTNLIYDTPITLSRKQISAPSESAEPEYIVLYHLGSKLCGHSGIIHGGLLATLLDESLCRCGFRSLPNKVGVTAQLNLKYLAPTPAESFVVLQAWATEAQGRKVTVKGTLNVVKGEPQEYEIKKTVEAECLVVEPKWVAKLQNGHFTPGEGTPQPEENREDQAQA